MPDMLAPHLFQSAARAGVLELLFIKGVSGSVSELARRASLTARSVANEVRHLLPTGLITLESVGGADLVRANPRHPAARHLRALLSTPAAARPDPARSRSRRESLAGWSAPLAGVRARRHGTLHQALMDGLEEARKDATVLRVLPTVLAANLEAVDWPGLREDARRRKLKAELGWLVEQTAELLGRDELKAEVASLVDRRRTSLRFLPEAGTEYERALARQRSPQLARRWGFWMNMSPESFRSTLERHRA